jgi:uncharacterized protein (DUF924 family)
MLSRVALIDQDRSVRLYEALGETEQLRFLPRPQAHDLRLPHSSVEGALALLLDQFLRNMFHGASGCMKGK